MDWLLHSWSGLDCGLYSRNSVWSSNNTMVTVDKKPMVVDKHGLGYYVDLITNRKPFSLLRYGDGEWNCMLGLKGANCDGHQYFPEMGQDLITSLQHNYNAYYGWLTVSHHAGMEAILDLIGKNNILVRWVNGDVFLEASCAGKMWPFIRIIRKRRVVYVGPRHLLGLRDKGVFSPMRFIEVPLINCYLDRARIMKEVIRAAKMDNPDIILFSAGMPTKVMIDQLYPQIGGKITMIDMGSVFDPYVNVISRKHARLIDWKTIIPLNLGEKPKGTVKK